MACAFRRHVKCGGHMLLRVLGGGCYLTCHPSTTGGLRCKHILPSVLVDVSIWWTRHRGSETKGSVEGVERDNDDDSHFSLSLPIVCCCWCPETQHICSCVCVRGMIRFIIICECSDRLMSYKVIQEHAAPVECCLQNKHINLTSSKSVLIDYTLSWHELHVQGECPKKLDIQELSSLHINQKKRWTYISLHTSFRWGGRGWCNLCVVDAIVFLYLIYFCIC